jgi:bacteriocin-like protein
MEELEDQELSNVAGGHIVTLNNPPQNCEDYNGIPTKNHP